MTIPDPDAFLVITFFIGSLYATFGFGFQAIIYVLVASQLTSINQAVTLNALLLVSAVVSGAYRGATSGTR